MLRWRASIGDTKLQKEDRAKGENRERLGTKKVTRKKEEGGQDRGRDRAGERQWHVTGGLEPHTADT